jgi:hypothetical protein
MKDQIKKLQLEIRISRDSLIHLEKKITAFQL